jgi:hypothetical protein
MRPKVGAGKKKLDFNREKTIKGKMISGKISHSIFIDFANIILLKERKSEN